MNKLLIATASLISGLASLAPATAWAGVGDTVSDRMGLTYSYQVRNSAGLTENQTWANAWANLSAGVTRISPERSWNY